MSITRVIASIDSIHGGPRSQVAQHNEYLQWLKKRRETRMQDPEEPKGIVGRTFIDMASGRKLIVTGSYDGEGPEDPPGYYYHYFDEPLVTKWITTLGTTVRWTSGVDKQA